MLAADGLVVQHYNAAGRFRTYDFSTLPVTEAMQRSLAALFAARCTPGKWTSHATSMGSWWHVVLFAEYLSTRDTPPADLDELTGTIWKEWVVSRPATSTGWHTVTTVASLLLTDPRLRLGPVADVLTRRVMKPKRTVNSYTPAEFDKVKMAARRTFRAALLRICDNSRHLEQWRAEKFIDGSKDWLIGEGLDWLARTGDLPRYVRSAGTSSVVRKYQRVLGGKNRDATWKRLFLSRHEAVALGVLLMAEYGWNLSVISSVEVPMASPDAGEDGKPTYRIPLQKPRRGAGGYYETRNVTDDGADSKGRLITQALEATRFARAAVEELSPAKNLLMVWRSAVPSRQLDDQDREPPIGPFRFGMGTQDAQEWARVEGLDGSPFQRGRRTVNVIDRREPGQNSRDTHDSVYALVDPQVQRNAVPVIAAGAEAAAERARKTVLVAEVHDESVPGDLQTPTADCHGYNDSPYPSLDGGCAASFLMCLGCVNARVHPGHHARLAHLHHALENLRTVLEPTLWQGDWADTHARLEDLKSRIGDRMWAQAQDRVTASDRGLIDHLLTGDLDA
ncbi:hypothetical protein ACFXKI_08120 [Streptomyces mirabilis]|uniref:hypothetical protein n=1 Tax=Streptomyces mirabilis TaxID=68239 RepID=UPI00367EB5FD